MNVKVVDVDGAAELLSELVEDMNMSVSDRVRLATSILILPILTTVDLVADFKDRVDSVSTVDLTERGITGPAHVISCMKAAAEFIKFYVECIEQGRCICGRPDCVANRKKGSDSTPRTH